MSNADGSYNNKARTSNEGGSFRRGEKKDGSEQG